MSTELHQFLYKIFAEHRTCDLEHRPEIFLEALLKCIIEELKEAPRGHMHELVERSFVKAFNLKSYSQAMSEGERELLNR